MLVVKSKTAGALCCVLVMLLMTGCRGNASYCPQGSVTADPQEIPAGTSETDLFVTVHIPFPVDGLVAVLYLTSGGTMTLIRSESGRVEREVDITAGRMIVWDNRILMHKVDAAAGGQVRRLLGNSVSPPLPLLNLTCDSLSRLRSVGEDACYASAPT